MNSFMLIRHKVRDFTAWKTEYVAHQPKRIEAGLTDKYLFQNSDDPNELDVNRPEPPEYHLLGPPALSLQLWRV